MKKWTALLLAMWIAISMTVPALAAGAEPAAPSDEDFVVDESAAGDDSEWLYDDDDEGAEDPFGLADEDIEAELAAADDGAPITQVNEDDQEDLLGAMEVYSWFALTPLDYDEDVPGPDGARWRVLDERFNTPELMKDMLSFYFSDGIVDELWNSSANPYQVVDGYLYTDGEGRDVDEAIGETAIEVVEKTDDRIVLTATVQYLDPAGESRGEEVFTFTRELVGGEWKYTEFPFFW